MLQYGTFDLDVNGLACTDVPNPGATSAVCCSNKLDIAPEGYDGAGFVQLQLSRSRSREGNCVSRASSRKKHFEKRQRIRLVD